MIDVGLAIIGARCVSGFTMPVFRGFSAAGHDGSIRQSQLSRHSFGIPRMLGSSDPAQGLLHFLVSGSNQAKDRGLAVRRSPYARQSGVLGSGRPPEGTLSGSMLITAPAQHYLGGEQ